VRRPHLTAEERKRAPRALILETDPRGARNGRELRGKADGRKALKERPRPNGSPR